MRKLEKGIFEETKNKEAIQRSNLRGNQVWWVKSVGVRFYKNLLSSFIAI